MVLPSADTPIYNHPLPEIERWLTDLGCQQDRDEPHCWYFKKSDWQANIYLEIDEFVVCYKSANLEDKEIKRSFKYSLSRQDIESAVFSGP